MTTDNKTLVVDALAVVDELIDFEERHAEYEPRQNHEAREARAAVAELIEKGEAMLPRNLCLGNSNISDSVKIPLVATMGELRAFASALARVKGESA